MEHIQASLPVVPILLRSFYPTVDLNGEHINHEDGSHRFHLLIVQLILVFVSCYIMYGKKNGLFIYPQLRQIKMSLKSRLMVLINFFSSHKLF